MLNSREFASLILIGALISVLFVLPKTRRAVGPHIIGILRIIAASETLLLVWGLFLLWSAGWVWLAARAGAWNFDLLKDTLVIVFTIGFPLLFQAVSAKSGAAIIRRIAGETIAISAFLLFYLNLEPFPLWAELIVQPLVTFLALTQYVASRKSGAKRIHGCLGVLLTVLGILLALWTTVQIVLGAAERDWEGTLLGLALSIWLPLAMFPFFYATAFYSAAQKIARRLRRIYKPPALRRVTLAVILGFHFRLKWSHNFVPSYEKRFLRAKTFGEAVGLMSDFRSDVERREGLEADRLANLEAFSGQPGADGRGGQLDRREFEGTKRALEFIDVAQGLRYERLGNRYWNDLTDLVLQPADRFGLPHAHGVRVETTADGQAWRAWRRMPSGWHLGIGGTGGKPGHFLYTGADKPTNWPGDPGWSDVSRDLVLPEDWTRRDRPVI